MKIKIREEIKNIKDEIEVSFKNEMKDLGYL